MNPFSIGVDISRYQGQVDFAQLAEWLKQNSPDGKGFAILKSVSTNPKFGGLYIDEFFEHNYNECKRYGIPVGAYYYTYATEIEYANKEIALFLSSLAGKSFEYPIAIDVEDNLLKPLSAAALTSLVVYAAEKLQNNGLYVSIYTYSYYSKTELNMAALSKFDQWRADYTGVPFTAYGIHQYTSKGRVSGVSGYVDLNRAYKNYTEIIKKAGLNNSLSQPIVTLPTYYSITIPAVTSGDKNTISQLCETLKLRYEVKEVEK